MRQREAAYEGHSCGKLEEERWTEVSRVRESQMIARREERLDRGMGLNE